MDQHPERGLALAWRIEAGSTSTDSHSFDSLDPRMPFGGIEQSGVGREFGSAGLNEYVEEHSIRLLGWQASPRGGSVGDDGHRPTWSGWHTGTAGDRVRTTSGGAMQRQQGVPARELSEEDLEQQGIQAHATRHWVFLHGTEEQFRTHTERMLELEEEYLRRHPKRTWQGSQNTATRTSRDERIKDLVATFTLAMTALLDEPADDPAPPPVGSGAEDPVAGILQGFISAEGGRMHKLEAHQLSRALAPDSHVVAGLYRQDPPLLRAEGDLRVITPAGRAWLAQHRRAAS